MEFSATTRVVGVIGWPLGHTLSPAMHNAALEKAALDWVYLAFPVNPDHVEHAIRGMRALNFEGLNVTIPHKESVMPFLDELSEDARRIGAVNTIALQNGKLFGTNTDAYGFLKTLGDEGAGDLAGKRVTILGCGGAARAIATACASQQVAELVLTDIAAERAAALRETVASHFPGLAVRAVEPGSGDLHDAAKHSGLLINATPLGMKAEDPLPLREDAMPEGAVVFDAVYNPADTAFLRVAADRKCRPIGGLGMLAHQGARSFEIWTGVAPDVELMKKVLREKLFGTS